MTTARNIPAATSAIGQPQLPPPGEELEIGPTPGPAVRRRELAPERPTEDRSPRPRAVDAIAMTVRVTPDEHLRVERDLLELKAETGRTSLDKSELLRALLVLARERDAVRAALLDYLR